VDWSHTRQRPQQLAIRFARSGRVVFVEPTGLRPPRLSDLPRACARLYRRLHAPSSGAVAIASPLAVVPWRGARWASRLVGRRLRRCVEARAARQGLREPVLWVSTPSPEALVAVEELSGLVVYDWIDDLATLRADPVLTRAEEGLARRADLVVATSARLLERSRPLNPRSHLVPNGCDPAHFSGPLASEIPEELTALPRPILGYVGEIAEWFDTSAVAELCRRYPDGSVVLVGPVRSRRLHRQLAFPNLHLLGARDYDSVPAYVASFDVCLIPFRVTEFTAAVNPVKLYEYLAAGRPVASTPLPEVTPFADLVAIAEGRRLHDAVAAALSQPDTESARERRRRFAAANTWDQRVERIGSLLDQVAGR